MKEAKQDLVKMREVNKSMMTEVESGVRNEGYKRTKICGALANMKMGRRLVAVGDDRVDERSSNGAPGSVGNSATSRKSVPYLIGGTRRVIR